MTDLQRGGLLRIRLNQRDIGFLTARLTGEPDRQAGWGLRVESPDDVDEFRDGLRQGSIMSVRMVLRTGDFYRGQACVSSIDESAEAPTLIVLAGVGPLVSD